MIFMVIESYDDQTIDLVLVEQGLDEILTFPILVDNTF